jgi:outer membrane protein assembly factor BamD (BamD/ComL family)
MNLASDNPQANRDTAIGYLRQVLRQYPNSELNNQAAKHLDSALNNRTL